jgi:hypothetical protein
MGKLKQRVWKYARVTYNNGTSYTVGRFKFEKGVPKPCNDRRVVRRMEAVRGTGVEHFYSEVEEEPKPDEPTVRKAIKVKKKSEEE